MIDLPDPQAYYFSSNHLAADVLYNSAGFAFFCALAGVLYPDLYQNYLGMFKTVAGYDSTVLAIFVVILFIVLGAAAGLLSSRLVSSLRVLVPGLRDRVGYRRLYKKRRKELEALYEEHFGTCRLSSEASLTSSEIVNRLMLLLRPFNSIGYNHIYRAYSIVSLFRQFLVYTVVLFLLHYWFTPALPLLPVIVILFVLEGTGLRFAIANALAAEYDFIEVAARVKQEVRSEAEVNSNATASRREAVEPERSTGQLRRR